MMDQFITIVGTIVIGTLMLTQIVPMLVDEIKSAWRKIRGTDKEG